MNLFNYIDKHKNESFKDFKFNEIDNLILSLLPYIDFKDIVPAFNGKKITLEDAAKIIRDKNLYHGLFIGKTYKMLQEMASTKRYGNSLLYNYMNVVNEEMQFGAITIKLNDKSIFIAFAGTDTSVIGFLEDFKMAYLFPGASQKYAAIYLNKAIGLKYHNVRIGGHSKGGNLAISAAMMSKFYVRAKIIAIYNNDGPGFLKEQIISKEYKRIQKKIKMFVPEESIIGMILYHGDYVVVKADSFNIFQHDAFNWQCGNEKFLTDKQHKRSKNLEKELNRKLELVPIEERIKIITEVVTIFRNNGIKNAKDIKLKKLFKLIKGFNNLSKYTKIVLTQLLLDLFIK